MRKAQVSAVPNDGRKACVYSIEDLKKNASTTPRATGRKRVVGVGGNNSFRAYLLYAAGGPMELAGAAGVLAAFAPGGHDAAVIHDGKLTLFQDIAGAATERSFAGIAAPSALAFSPDSQKLFVASATGRTVTTIQVATGDRSALACDCAPAALIPMGSVFRLTELGSGPLWLLDTASARGLFFVPAPAGK